jgi:hybrid cluster-associated redox disulfide protein
MKNKAKITKDILILDLVEQNPALAEVLTQDYGLHCIGCMAASMETLEQGALTHGMTEDQIDKMVRELNKKLDK